MSSLDYSIPVFYCARLAASRRPPLNEIGKCLNNEIDTFKQINCVINLLHYVSNADALHYPYPNYML